MLCIETCGKSIERIAAANQVVPQPALTTLSPTADSIARPDSLAPDAFAGHAGAVAQHPVDDHDFPFSLDIPWDHLWDDLSEPWRLPDQL